MLSVDKLCVILYTLVVPWTLTSPGFLITRHRIIDRRGQAFVTDDHKAVFERRRLSGAIEVKNQIIHKIMPNSPLNWLNFDRAHFLRDRTAAKSRSIERFDTARQTERDHTPTLTFRQRRLLKARSRPIRRRH